MSNPFKQIKQEVHLTDAEKLRMRNSLVLEMQKTVETDFSPSSYKNNPSFAPINILTT